MKLATRIIAVSLITVLVHAVVAGYLTVRNAFSEFERQQQEVAERVAQTMSELLVDAWRTSGSAGVARLLREGGPTRNLGISVRWVWFEENVPTSELPLAPRNEWPSRVQPTTVSAIVVDQQGSRRLHTYVPLPVTPGRRGGLEFASSLAPIDRQTSAAIWTSLATTGVVAVSSILAAYATGMAWVARPLQALIDKTRRIGAGDFSNPLNELGNDELGDLGRALNQMCQQLESQQAAIRTESASRIAALEQLRHADRLKTVGRLAAGIAHELGTPLNVVAGHAQLITSGRLSNSEIQRSAATIKSEADRITTIVQQLLTFARRQKPQQVTTDLLSLVQTTTALLKSLADKQGVQFVVHPTNLSTDAIVDPAQIQQVLTNLLVNAVQAMHQGGSIDIRLSHDAPPRLEQENSRWLCLSISDQGPGIAADDLPHVFEPFFTTKETGEGTGLGLSIAIGIVQEHGGRLEVVSPPGCGACFSIFLPRGELV